jgi:hypothetical protein
MHADDTIFMAVSGIQHAEPSGMLPRFTIRALGDPAKAYRIIPSQLTGMENHNAHS